MYELLGHQVRETLDEVLDPAITALVVVDMQVGGLSTEGAMGSAGHDVSMMAEALEGSARAIAAARENGVPVVHIRVGNLPNGDSSPGAWLRALQLQSNGPIDLTQLSVDGDPATEFAPECRPEPGEVVISKRRPSAFFNTELAQVLRTKGIESVAIVGVSTSICIEATLRDATHHDFYAVLLEDATGDYERDIHEAAMKVMRARNDVTTVAEAAAIWARGAKRPEAVAVGGASR